MSGKFFSRLIVTCALATAAGCACHSPWPNPHLEKQGSATQLIVDGHPMLIRGGEVHNSSSSSLAYMQDIWPRLAKMNLNAVLTPVSWEQVEPAEGEFHFHVVDGLLEQARANHEHIVFLWMGSWKNGTSRYQPAWVKEDQQRFPLVLDKDGNSLEILSTFGDQTCQADAKAYAAFMRHLRAVDSLHHTVVMIQLENEVGILGDSRDRTPAANAAFDGPVPAQLMDYLQAHKDNLSPQLQKAWEAAGSKTSGTWQEVFGSGVATDEFFMAWNYARYCNRVSAAGKAEYPLPTYMNNWIVQPQDKGPGDYPSGGPTAQVHDIYRAAGTAIDMLSPDIYLPNFTEVAGWFTRAGNPLFIPESRPNAANAFYAVGRLGAIGFSPFGIDAGEPDNGPTTRAYSLLAHLAPLILKHQGDGTMAAVILSRDHTGEKVSLGDYTLNVALPKPRYGSPPDSGYAILIQISANEYAIAGASVAVTFTPNTPGPAIVGLAKVREDMLHDGKWIPGRWLNGDEVQLRYDLGAAAAEKLSGSGIRLVPDGPTVQYAWLYRYQ